MVKDLSRSQAVTYTGKAVNISEKVLYRDVVTTVH